MKRVLIAAALCAVAVTACSEDIASEAPIDLEYADPIAPTEQGAAPAGVTAPVAPAPIQSLQSEGRTAEETPADLRRPAASTPRAPGNPLAVPLPKLAYEHKVALETDSRSVAMLVEKHQDACHAAGPALCQVTGAGVRQESRNVVTGSLSLRGEPMWIEGFRKGLAADAEAVGGRLVANDTGTEELTRRMIDTQAQMEARTAMRDRLQYLARNHKGTLQELVEIEYQLAQVQAEIDSARAGLAEMRTRVAMSRITVEYGPRAGLVQDGAWSPVADAVRGSQNLMANTIAALILMASVLLPIGAIIALAVYFIRGGRKPVASS